MSIVLASLLLGACASHKDSSEHAELATSSDQTDNQKRSRIRLQLAVDYYEQRQMSVALDEVKLALQADPNSADAYSVRALIYMEMGETRLAEENFNSALRLAPNNPDIANNYGWFLCLNGREAESIVHFEAAIANKSYQAPSKALNNAGVCSLKTKDVAKAERYFLQAFQFDPGNLLTSLNLGKIYYDRADYERARFYIGRVIKGDMLTPEALWLGIKIEHKMGDRAAETSLGTQLRRRHPASKENGSYQRGAFDE
jgi:type IV pilus assembly protein PilF